MRFAQYYTQMKAVDPTIKIGAVADITEDGTANYSNHAATNPVTGVTTTAGPGDAGNLCEPIIPMRCRTFSSSTTMPPAMGISIISFGLPIVGRTDAANLRMMLNDYLGGQPGRRTSNLPSPKYGPGGAQLPLSLVGGLFEADTIGVVLQTEFNAFLRWDLHNGPSALTDADNA